MLAWVWVVKKVRERRRHTTRGSVACMFDLLFVFARMSCVRRVVRKTQKTRDGG